MLVHERYDDLLNDFKLLINKEELADQDNQIIELILKKTIQDVANYTNIPINELPEDLDSTIVAMANQILETHDWLNEDDDRDIQSLTEGDASISFKSISSIYAELQNINVISDNYANILNNFRRVQW